MATGSGKTILMHFHYRQFLHYNPKALDNILLVTPDDSQSPTTAELLEMAGEAEELIGAPVDFVLRQSLEKSPNHFAREHILATAVCVYGS